MYNKYMNEKEINVKVGDRVSSHGFRGTVIEVIKGFDKEWNGKEYVKVKDSDYTHVSIHFDDNQWIAEYGQYQNGSYGEYEVIS